METVTKEIQVYTIEELKEFNKKAYDKLLNKFFKLIELNINSLASTTLENLINIFEQNNFNVKLKRDYERFFAVVTNKTYDQTSIYDEKSIKTHQNNLLNDLLNMCDSWGVAVNFLSEYNCNHFDTFNEFVAEIFLYLSKKILIEKAYYYDDKNLIQYIKEFDGETLYTIDGINIKEL